MDIKFKDETLHFDTLVEFNIAGESFIFQGDMTGTEIELFDLFTFSNFF
jgi:hypothetical protein